MLTMSVSISNGKCCKTEKESIVVIFQSVFVYSGEGSQYSGNSDERNLAAMARAIAVHPDTFRVMYFA